MSVITIISAVLHPWVSFNVLLIFLHCSCQCPLFTEALSCADKRQAWQLRIQQWIAVRGPFLAVCATWFEPWRGPGEKHGPHLLVADKQPQARTAPGPLSIIQLIKHSIHNDPFASWVSECFSASLFLPNQGPSRPENRRWILLDSAGKAWHAECRNPFL